MEHSEAEIKKHVKVYLTVFAALMALTVITVLVSYLHLSHTQAVIVALFIALVKGSLVAAFFMHLVSEKVVIYGILALTVLFFAIALLGPVMSPVVVPILK